MLRAKGRSAQGAWITVHGDGDSHLGPLDRVLVVVRYQTPEMDYFSDRACPFSRT